jgi:hypothetical protein
MTANARALKQERASWAALRRFTSQPTTTTTLATPPPAERCELCSTELGPAHQHLVEPSTRRVLCACDACALLFSLRADTKYRRVPRRTRCLDDFRLSDAQWDGLLIPIGLAFFFRNSVGGKIMALYPSPGGPIESLLDLSCWEEIVHENPLLEQMEPDVEALLVNRLGQRREYYLAPIDECYRLVGVLRAHWQGLSGGDEVWQEIDRFFAELKQRS